MEMIASTGSDAESAHQMIPPLLDRRDVEGLRDTIIAILAEAPNERTGQGQKIADLVNEAANTARAAGDEGYALSLMDLAAPALVHVLSFATNYTETLVHAGRHEEARRYSEDMLAASSASGWAWYWTIWAAIERGDFESADILSRDAEAALGPLPEVLLGRLKLLERRMQDSELAALIRRSAELRAAYPDLCATVSVSANLSRSDYLTAVTDFTLFEPVAIPPLARLELIWRILNTTVADPSTTSSLLDQVSAALLPALASLDAETDPQILVILLRRIAELHYKDRASLLALRASWKRAGNELLLARSRMGRFLSFVARLDLPGRVAIEPDMTNLLEAGTLEPAYFVYSQEWSLFPLPSTSALTPPGSGSASAFLAYLFALVRGPDRADDLLNALPTEPEDAAAALRQIATARSGIKARLAHSVTKSRSGPLRIALCVSGQLRGFKSAFRTWQKLGLWDHDVTTFVHSWYEVGRKSPTAQNLDRSFSGESLAVVTEFFGSQDLRAFSQRYPRLVSLLADAGRADEQELRDLYRTNNVILQDDLAPPYAGRGNSDKMYAKIAAAHAMVEDPQSFDLIVRIRPDIAFETEGRLDWDRLLHDSARDATFFSDHPSIVHLEMGVVFGDQMAIGVPEVMNVYAGTHAFIASEGGKRYQVPNMYLPHTSLVWTAAYGGIHCAYTPGIPRSTLLGPDPLAPDQLLAALRSDLATREQNSFDHRFENACLRDCAASIGGAAN